MARRLAGDETGRQAEVTLGGPTEEDRLVASDVVHQTENQLVAQGAQSR